MTGTDDDRTPLENAFWNLEQEPEGPSQWAHEPVDYAARAQAWALVSIAESLESLLDRIEGRVFIVDEDEFNEAQE